MHGPYSSSSCPYTCRSPYTHASAAVALGGRLHSPKGVLLPFDRADLVEDHGLVMAHLLPAAEGASVGFRQVHIQNISRLDLPSDRDPVHGDRHLLAWPGPAEPLFSPPNRFVPAEGPPFRRMSDSPVLMRPPRTRT